MCRASLALPAYCWASDTVLIGTDTAAVRRFQPFGQVSSAKISREGGESLGHGVVEFKAMADAQKALTHLDGFDLAGQALQVELVAAPTAMMLPVAGLAGPATEMLDDNELGGVHVSAQSRHQLMQKLARNADMGAIGQAPAMGMGPPGMPPPGMPPPGFPPAGMIPGVGGLPPRVMPPAPQGVPGAFMPAGQPSPSQYLLLNNMFDPAK